VDIRGPSAYSHLHTAPGMTGGADGPRFGGGSLFFRLDAGVVVLLGSDSGVEAGGVDRVTASDAGQRMVRPRWSRSGAVWRWPMVR
jgi:hypothetical protein